jgi:uncharacterized protein (DUF58 family)
MSLSGRALILVSLIILLAIAGVWAGPPLQGIWRLPAIILLLFIVWERAQTGKQFSIKRDIIPRLFLGVPAHYQQMVINHGRYTLSMDSQTDYPDLLETDRSIQSWIVPAGESLKKSSSVIPVALGKAELGKVYVRVLGRFGLIWWRHDAEESVQFQIEPALLKHTINVFGQTRSGGRKTRYRAGSGFELLNFREYQYGDPLHGIDWKASARRQKTVVKVFSKQQRLEIAILLDCGRASLIKCGLMDRLHHYANITSRLAEFAVQNEDQLACIAYADKTISHVPMSGGVSAVQKIRQLLTRLDSVAEESNPLAVALELKRYLKHRSLVIFLTEMEQAEAATQLIQSVQLLRGKHHIVVASIDDSEINKLLKQTGQGWFAPYQNFAALEYCRGRELTCNKLRQLGVEVLTALPENLDAEVLNFYQRIRERREV